MAPVRKFRVSRWQQQGSKPRGPSQRKGICLCSCPRVSSTVLTDKEINTERESNCAENRDRPSHWIQVCLNTRLGYVIVVWSLSCVQLCDMDCSQPGSSVRGISHPRILEWVAISFSRGSSWSRDWTRVSCPGGWVLYCWDTREALSR